MYLMIDNYDSFVYNLARYLEELGEKVTLVRNDKITADHIESMVYDGSLEGIILSPGPKSPADCGNCKEILKRMAGSNPGSVPWPSDYWARFWCNCKEREPAHAWKGNSDYHRRNRTLPESSGYLPGNQISFSGDQ